MKSLFILILFSLSSTSAAMGFGWLECRERIFLGEDDLPELRADLDFWVVVRVLGDCDTERQVKLVRRGKQIQAEVLHPVKKSISEQLELLGKRFPEAEPEALCDLVKLERRVFDETKKPGLPKLVKELEDLSVSPVLEPVIYIHGASYKIWVGSSINLSYFDFEGPPYRRSARQNLHPLDVWSQRLLATVDASCDPEEF